MNTLKELLSLGFTPAAALAIFACAALWWRQESKDRKQTRDREAWHEETRKRVEAVEVHAEECNKERSTLMVKVATLEERTLRLSNCPRKDCPMRLP